MRCSATRRREQSGGRCSTHRSPFVTEQPDDDRVTLAGPDPLDVLRAMLKVDPEASRWRQRTNGSTNRTLDPRSKRLYAASSRRTPLGCSLRRYCIAGTGRGASAGLYGRRGVTSYEVAPLLRWRTDVPAFPRRVRHAWIVPSVHLSRHRDPPGGHLLPEPIA